MNSEKLKENTVYVVRDGKLSQIDEPKTGFGKTILHWQDGKIVSTEINYTIR